MLQSPTLTKKTILSYQESCLKNLYYSTICVKILQIIKSVALGNVLSVC